jgi:MFS family permease
MPLMNSLVPEDFRAVVTGPLRRFYLCITLACVGNGLTLSLFVVYLHNVRHFSITFATLLLAFTAVAGLATSPLTGTLVDRLGPVPIMVGSFLIEAGALVIWAFARHTPQIVVADVMLSVFSGSTWGPGTTMMSRLVPEEHRQRAFGINFMLVNLGIGLGGLISATIVDLHHPYSFTVLYLLNAAVCVFIAALFLTFWSAGRPGAEHLDDARNRDEGWREVLRDKRLVRYVLASLVLMIAGYGSIEAGFSVYVVNDLHLSIHFIGVMLFFDTSTIVATQLFILNRIEGRSRTRVMAWVGVLWFFFWMILFVSIKMPSALAIVSICIGIVIFAVGETMMSPVGPALVNEIAPEHLRGRYNAANGLIWGLASTLAPAITAFFFSEGWGRYWPLLIGCTGLVGSLMMLTLRRSLNAREDGLAPASTR